MKPAVSSLYQSIEIVQDIPPLMIGERCNCNGSKKFRELLLADDFDGCLQMALDQEARGAQVLDLCVAYAGRDETADMLKLVPMFAQSVKAPLMIDSTTPDCLEKALKLYPGRAIINSINLEDGGKNLDRICRLARRYGAAVVALVIDEGGMAMTCAEKVRIAERIYHLATETYGLRAQDLFFDLLTFTIGSGDETLFTAGIETLNAIEQFKQAHPDVFTLLGLSNISFGLRPWARKVLNSIFLNEAVKKGLDGAIVDAAKIVPLAQIEQADRDICLDLVYNRTGNTEESPLMAFINYFETEQVSDSDSDEDAEVLRPQQRLHQMVLKGDKEALEDTLSILLQRQSALDIINNVLIAAMREVGVLFGKGEILLPFVLQSAEVMKASVSFLEDYMEHTEHDDRVKILLATVQGDVHDIGKNLVDIILTNNGYQVFNLGIKVPAETIIEKARAHQVDIIGLSGLLVKSAIVMQESLPQYEQAGVKVPILLGGAALTPKFVAQSCVPNYSNPVVYCADAFAGLKAVGEYEAGSLASTTWQDRPSKPVAPSETAPVDVARDNPVPAPPFYGARYVTDVDVEPLFSYINTQALFRGRWGYRRKKMPADEYQDLIENTVTPLYETLKQRMIDDTQLSPQVAYGYYRCFSQANTVVVQDEACEYRFDFPRQSNAPDLCIADFFKTEKEGGDVVGFFVVTIGDRICQEIQTLLDQDAYHDYLMLHGLSVEVTDALAEYWHEEMRKEMSINADRPDENLGYITQEYQGSRYGFGYPACPDLDAHKVLFELLKPETVGITLTENMQMVPEQTTSAIVAHHPQAKYFAV